MPALIVNGARDTAGRRARGPALARRAARRRTRVILDDAAHLPNLDAPHEYNQLICEFARRHLPAAA